MSLSNNAMMIKTKAIFGERLKSIDYQELMKKKDISEISYYLKNNTYFKQCLDGINEKSIHRGQLEILIRMDLFNRISKIMRYSKYEDDGFYKFIIIEGEINLILEVIKGFMLQSKANMIANLPLFLTGHTKINLTKLVDADNIEELLEVIKNTQYYKVLLKYKKSNLSELDYAGLEHDFKSLYYEEVLKLVDKNFKGKILKTIKSIILSKLELENIVKIYRLKKYFNASNVDIRKYITPIYNIFPKQVIDSFIETNDYNFIIQKLKTSRYGYYLKDSRLESIEYYTKKINYEICKKHIFFSNNSDIIILVYEMMSSIEIDNIIDIIEGVRYKMPIEQINRLLVY